MSGVWALGYVLCFRRWDVIVYAVFSALFCLCFFGGLVSASWLACPVSLPLPLFLCRADLLAFQDWSGGCSQNTSIASMQLNRVMWPSLTRLEAVSYGGGL